MSAFLELLLRGGPTTWIIFGFGVLALILIFERALHLHRAHINVPEFMRGVINVLRRGNVVEAVSICDETPGPVAHILRAAIINGSRGERTMQEACRDVSLEEIPRLEKGLNGLTTIATLATLLGLLGTVIGMIDLFQDMEAAGSFVDVSTLAEGIWRALISTAAGLTVAIVSHGFHNYFVGRVQALVLDMEKAGSEMIHFLLENEMEIGEAGGEPTAELD